MIQIKSLYIVFILICVSQCVFSQVLPSNFEYKTKINKQTGKSVYVLTVNNDAVNYSDKTNYPFEALIFEITPSENKYDLILLNAKKEYQFKEGENEGGTLTIEDEIIELPEYSIIFKKQGTNLKFEAAGLIINKENFDKIAKSQNITVNLGRVKYVLDRDNIVAIHYFAKQISQPTSTTEKQTNSVQKNSSKKTVTKTQSQKSNPTNHIYYRGPKGGCYYITANGSKSYVPRSYCS